jgi:regulator of replication initiation timing
VRFEKQINTFIKSNQDQDAEIKRFMQKEQSFIEEINSLRIERERLQGNVNMQNSSLHEAQKELKLIKSRPT